MDGWMYGSAVVGRRLKGARGSDSTSAATWAPMQQQLLHAAWVEAADRAPDFVRRENAGLKDARRKRARKGPLLTGLAQPVRPAGSRSKQLSFSVARKALCVKREQRIGALGSRLGGLYSLVPAARAVHYSDRLTAKHSERHLFQRSCQWPWLEAYPLYQHPQNTLGSLAVLSSDLGPWASAPPPRRSRAIQLLAVHLHTIHCMRPAKNSRRLPRRRCGQIFYWSLPSADTFTVSWVWCWGTEGKIKLK